MLHALACDRCKEYERRPGESDVLPTAIHMLRDDGSRSVRSQAAAIVGPAVHRSNCARRALEEAPDGDLDPVVRKIAGWHARGRLDRPADAGEAAGPRPAGAARAPLTA